MIHLNRTKAVNSAGSGFDDQHVDNRNALIHLSSLLLLERSELGVPTLNEEDMMGVPTLNEEDMMGIPTLNGVEMMMGADHPLTIRASRQDSIRDQRSRGRVFFDEIPNDDVNSLNLVQILRSPLVAVQTIEASATGKSSSFDFASQFHNTNQTTRMTASRSPFLHSSVANHPQPEMNSLHHHQNNGPCSPLRRSRSIAIKLADPDELRESTNINTLLSAEYDWATWRMYNRIIDHRLKYSLNCEPTEAIHHGDKKKRMTAKDELKPVTLANSFALPVEKDYSHYGEVFELEL